MDNVGVYHTGGLTFYIYPKKVIVCTTLQCFRIIITKPRTGRDMKTLRRKILAGQVNCLNDIASLTNNLTWENNTKI